MSSKGLSQNQWNSAKNEIRGVLVKRARTGTTISYSELANGIGSLLLEARDQRLFQLLGEISTEESSAGRGMLSVIVVHKTGDMKPGPGFFELAEQLGRDTSDIDKCWIEELNKVYAAWSGN
jgi:hypothetical protein